MNSDRINELQDISNDFLRRLGEDEDEFDSAKRPLKTEIKEDFKNNANIRSLNLPNFSITHLYRKEKEKKNSLVILYY